MPDHLQMMVGFQATQTSQTSFATSSASLREIARIRWQRNFFDHRLRHDESEAEKFEYIRQNPVRAGLIRAEDEWLYILLGEGDGGSPESSAGD
jgi:putative transposase